MQPRAGWGRVVLTTTFRQRRPKERVFVPPLAEERAFVPPLGARSKERVFVPPLVEERAFVPPSGARSKERVFVPPLPGRRQAWLGTNPGSMSCAHLRQVGACPKT